MVEFENLSKKFKIDLKLDNIQKKRKHNQKLTTTDNSSKQQIQNNQDCLSFTICHAQHLPEHKKS